MVSRGDRCALAGAGGDRGGGHRGRSGVVARAYPAASSPRAGCTYLGVDSSSSALEIARASGPADPRAASSSRGIASTPSPTVRRGAPARDHASPFPTRRRCSTRCTRALARGRFAFHFEEGSGGRSGSACWTPTRSGSFCCRRCSPTWSAPDCVRWQGDVSRSTAPWLIPCGMRSPPMRRPSRGGRAWHSKTCWPPTGSGARDAGKGRVRKFAFVAERT